MTRRVLSFDADGSLFNGRYHRAFKKDVVLHNKAFLDDLRQNKAFFDETIVFVGSNRQSPRLDKLNSVYNQTESCFTATEKVSRYLEATLDRFLLADIYHHLEDGEAFNTAFQSKSAQYDWVFDHTKASILYAQMHKIANQYPNEAIIFDFFDDRDDILQALETFYTTFPGLIPKNVVLRLNHYEGGTPLLRTVIQGTGMVDINYRKTVMDMTHASLKEQRGRYFLRTIRQKNTDVAHYLPSALKKDTATLSHREDKHHGVTAPIAFPDLRTTSVAIKGRETLEKELLVIEMKARRAKEEGHYHVARTASRLHHRLDELLTHLIEGRMDEQAFKRAAIRAVDQVRATLDKPSWRMILGNVVLAILGLGVIYAWACVVNKLVTGHFLFFKPEMNADLMRLKKNIDEIEVLEQRPVEGEETSRQLSLAAG